MPNTSPRPHDPPKAPKDATRPKPRSRFDPAYERLLEKIIAARKAAGLRQETVAKALGKTQSHVSMCESREREISIIDLWKWCMVLEMPLSSFIRELEEEGVSPVEQRKEKSP